MWRFACLKCLLTAPDIKIKILIFSAPLSLVSNNFSMPFKLGLLTENFYSSSKDNNQARGLPLSRRLFTFWFRWDLPTVDWHRKYVYPHLKVDLYPLSFSDEDDLGEWMAIYTAPKKVIVGWSAIILHLGESKPLQCRNSHPPHSFLSRTHPLMKSQLPLQNASQFNQLDYQT